VLPVDVQHSAAHYRAEPVTGPDGTHTLGVRLALADVHGISEEQIQRIVTGQPYQSLADWYARARPALPVAERLARIGALESLARGTHHRDLLLQLPPAARDPPRVFGALRSCSVRARDERSSLGRSGGACIGGGRCDGRRNDDPGITGRRYVAGRVRERPATSGH
jgi:hypothetical protein